MTELAKIGYEEYAAAERRFMRRPESWENIGLSAQASWAAAAKRIAEHVDGEWERRVRTEAAGLEQSGDGGQWMHIAFLGHVELTGYVTEITLGGQAAFRVDLPDKLWGGNPMAWEEYAASALYSRRPVTEESVRKSWERAQEWKRERAREEARWREEDAQHAIGAGDGDQGDDEENPF